MVAATYHATVRPSHLHLSELRHELRGWIDALDGAQHPPAIDIDVVVTDEPVLTSAWAEAGERGRGLRRVSALSHDLYLRSERGRGVVTAVLVGERQPVGEA